MNTKKFLTIAIGLSVLTMAGTSGEAAIWYLKATQSSDFSWNTLSSWNSSSDGSGTSPGAISSSDTYSTNGYTLRTPNSTSAATATQTFAGGTLLVDGGKLLLKSDTSIISNLVSVGGQIVNGSSSHRSDLTLQAANFQVNAATIMQGATDRDSTFSFGTLSGAGDLTIIMISQSSSGGGNFYLSASDASGYSGTLTLDSGSFDFDSDFTSSGALVIAGGTTFTLDQDLTFTGLTIDGDVFAAGTYSYSDLSNDYASVFGSSTAGSITVIPEPASLMLMGIGGLVMSRRRRH